MLNPFWPPCPRLHHGIMVADPCHQGRAGHEWVCRICGTRLYGNAQGEALPAKITYEQPVNANTGNHTGKPRERRPVGAKHSDPCHCKRCLI